MPDRRKHRGPHPEDARLFAPEVWPLLREATADLCWLLSRGYADKSALRLVGDRYELVARQRAASKAYDVILTLGCIIRGETSHFDFIARQVSHGVAQAGWETDVPCIFGVITADTREQADARSQLDGSGGLDLS